MDTSRAPLSKIQIDDLSRTERYYTATILPYLLLYDNFNGLIEFLRWLESKNIYALDAQTNTSCGLLSRRKITHIELITEMDIARDIRFYSRYISGLRGMNVAEIPSLRPDIVILTNQLVLVIEGKFFYDINSANDIREQLDGQRKVIKSVLLKFPGYSFDRYSQIFLAEQVRFSAEELDCQGTLTWSDVHDFSINLLGRSHYISRRLERAVHLYKLTSQNHSEQRWDNKNYTGTLSLTGMIRRCEELGDDIIVGYLGGIGELWLTEVEVLRKRIYKWDTVKDPIGKKNLNNWIPGLRFLEVIKSKLGDDFKESPKTYHSFGSASQSIGTNYRGKLPLEGVIRKCLNSESPIIIGYYGGIKELREATAKDLRNRREYKWDWADDYIKPKKMSNWLFCGEFLEVVFSKIPSLRSLR